MAFYSLLFCCLVQHTHYSLSTHTGVCPGFPSFNSHKNPCFFASSVIHAFYLARQNTVCVCLLKEKPEMELGVSNSPGWFGALL